MSWNSGRSRGRGGAIVGKRRPVVFGRNKDGKGYCINEKNLDTRSVSDHSSLTDVSITNLTTAGIQLDSSLLKVFWFNFVKLLCAFISASLSRIHSSSKIVSE